MSTSAGAIGRVLRGFLRSPLFTVVALVTLAVGIGANTALFSVVYGVLLKPLPCDEPDRLIGVWHTAPGMKIARMEMGPAFYLTYRDENRVFERLGLWASRAASVTGIGEPERVDIGMVTEGTLPALRIPMLLGRNFSPAEDSPAGVETAVLTFSYWQRKFGGDRGVLGRQIVVDGRPRQVIGVLPEAFELLHPRQAMLLPLRFDPAEVFIGNFAYEGVARLKPGIDLAAASRDVARMIPLVIEKFPLPPGFTKDMLAEVRMGPALHPLADDVIGEVGGVLWVLLGAVGLVLLVACANVANLFLVRAEGRQQELAIRSALGASRSRIAREMLGESLVLALAAGAAGTALAWFGLRLLVRLAPSGLPRLGEIGLDPAVLLFTLAISLLAGVLFGLVPVLKFSAPRLAALKDGGRSVSDSRDRHRARSVLVVAEVALALILLVGSGLLVRSFVELRRVDPGFARPDEVLTFRVAIPEAMIPEADRTARTYEQIVQRIAEIPGVGSVGVSGSITMDGNTDNEPLVVEDFPDPPGRMPAIRRFKWIGPNYFGAMGNRIVAGRDLTWADIHDGRPVGLISENLARQFWKRPADAVGRRMRSMPTEVWRTIIGVVGDERDDGVAQKAPAIVYLPLRLTGFWGERDYVRRSMGFAVRSGRLNSPGFIQEIQRAVWGVNSDLPLANVRTLDQIRSRSMAQTTLALVMLAVAAGVALLLGVVGIYGVIAYIAAQRTREVGIRMALGARPPDVSRLFLRQGLTLTAVGLGAGLAGAVAVTRLMKSLLFGVSAFDPVTFVGVAAGLGGVALLATYLPARRAARLDPWTALRKDG
jgi:putative ABC transport system permease protein